MAKQANRSMIGGFVLIAVAIMAASVVIFGSGDWFKDSLKYVLHFQESVKGLNVGSPVLYRGFPVGEVEGVFILADTKDRKDEVLVFVEIFPETVVFATGDLEIEQWKERMSDLIDRGLRAQMVPQSLITGKLIIELNMHADPPAIPKHADLNYLDILSDYEEIPTIPSTLSKLESALGNLDLKNISKYLTSVLVSADRILKNPDIDAGISELKDALVDARKLVNHVDEEVKPLSTKAQTTFDDVGKLAQHVDDKVDPLAKEMLEALKSADTAFKSIDELVGKRSPMRADLEDTLKEIKAAARSLRVLADYLEQHPDALLKGKGYKKY
jgi:paraquat-inducible protein B